jgi:hypothetical protein
MKASFRVANNYEVEIYWSPFGLEIYSVNGQEVLRKRSLSLRGSRKFVVGEGDERHEVEIRLDVAPTLRSWIFPGDWVAQAYVDGALVVDDLTPKIRRNVRQADKVLNWCLVAVFIVLAVVVMFSFIVPVAC